MVCALAIPSPARASKVVEFPMASEAARPLAHIATASASIGGWMDRGRVASRWLLYANGRLLAASLPAAIAAPRDYVSRCMIKAHPTL